MKAKISVTVGWIGDQSPQVREKKAIEGALVLSECIGFSWLGAISSHTRHVEFLEAIGELLLSWCPYKCGFSDV